MTDWLNEVLDHNSGEAAPDGFTERVLQAVHSEEENASPTSPGRPRGWVLHLPALAGMTAAAALLLAFGFWLGAGAKELQPTLVSPSSTHSASLDLEELYLNREMLRDFEILSDSELELAFQDEAAGTWILDQGLEEEGTPR